MSPWTLCKLSVMFLVFMTAMAVDAFWLSSIQPGLLARHAVDQLRDKGEAAIALRQYSLMNGVLTGVGATMFAGFFLFIGDLFRWASRPVGGR